ncbi:MAG: hypothetical protein AAF802_15820, partial [Planctomycetota bacterium]
MGTTMPNRDGCTITDRRRFLTRRLAPGLITGLAAVGGFSVTGCVGSGSTSEPDLLWGRRGQSEGRFLKPRAIAIDRNDLLYIVDTTGRIQVFDADGEWLRAWKTPQTANGRPTGMAIQHGATPDEDR